MTAALGLLALGAHAQNQPFGKPVAATQVARPSSAPAAAAEPVRKVVVARKGLAAISSTATGGNWNSPDTWVGAVVPTATDDVTIAGGATVTLNVAAACASLTVAATGSLLTSATTAYVLQVAGSVNNSGTLDLSASSAIGSDLRFVGAGDAAFAGSGTTDLQTMTLAKAVRADIVDLNLPALTVKGSATTGDGFLLTRTTGATPADDMTGTLKISGAATISSKVFGSAASYIIPATGGFWLNNPNFTVAAQTGSATVNGSLRVSAGTYNVGTAAGNSAAFGSGAVYTMDGGTLNAAGRFTSFTSATAAAAMTFNLSGGILNASTVGNASGTPSFGVNGTSTVSGGTINLVQRSTATAPLDYYVAGTYAYTGGTVNAGTAATATNFDFRMRGNMPNLTIDNTTNSKSVLLAGQTNPFGTVLITPGATLNMNGAILLQLGPAITNNGTLTGTATGSRLYFQGNLAQSIGGTGTVTSPLQQITFQNSSSGVTLGLPITTRNVAMFRGNVINANNLTVQSTTSALALISFGIASPTASAGSFDVAPTFDVSTSGLYLIYNPELAARTTGLEVPASRSVYFADFNNPQGVTVAGGDLTVVGPSPSVSSIGLLAGIVTTSPGNRLISGVATTVMPAGSATAYVKGPLGITVNSTAAVNRMFAVGDAAGFRPVVVTGITASTAQIFTATVINGATGGTGVSPVTNLNPTRYVRLENSANLPATARVQLSYGADDVVGDAATAVVAQAPTAAGAYAAIGGAAATTPTTGLVSTLDLTPGNDFFVLANTEGGTLASSVAAVCAGSNSGTLTLTNNAGTVVNYEFDNGAGFTPVAPLNTTATLTFTNLTATTTYRAVILTADGRTVYSTPVTVTVNPAPTATLTASTPTTFCGPGTLTLEAIPVAGATYQYQLNGADISGATSATYSATVSATGSYTVIVTNAAGCSATSAPVAVTVNPAATATFAYAGSTFCQSGANPTPTVTGTAGGTFSSTTGLDIDAATGGINLSGSALGTYTVTYSVGGSCPASTTATVTVSSAPVATFSYASASYCVGASAAPAPVFAAGASGGSFSASGTGLVIDAATGVINLATSAAGTYTVTNTIVASGGCSAAMATTSVTINAAPTATLTTTTPTTFCAGGSVVLTAPAGTGNTYQFLLNGTAIGGATAATYTATAAGAYSVVVTNTSGCAATSAATTVTVNPATTATFAYSGSAFCVSGTNPTPTVTGTAGGTFSSTAGLTLSAITGAITLASSTPGTYIVTYSVAGPCPSSATASVTVTAAPVATFSYATAAGCVGSAGSLTPTLGTGATAGAFSSTAGLALNATTGAIDLATSTAGTYTVTNTVAASGGCAAATATATFTVNPRPATPTLTAAYNGTTTTLTSSAATGNQFYFNGAIIAGATAQTYVVTGTTAQLGAYTVITTNATGCASLPSAPLVVTSAVKPLAGTSLSVYPNPTHDGRLTVELTGYRKPAELTVLNALGQVVFTGAVPASAGTAAHTVDLTTLAAGVYVLRVKTAGGLDTRRVVKE